MGEGLKMQGHKTKLYEFKYFRSSVFSYLKCDFGWNGLIPEKCDFDIVETQIKEGYDKAACELVTAHTVALYLQECGATWSKRIDGKPNTYQPGGF